jgi:hypothetical protein
MLDFEDPLVLIANFTGRNVRISECISERQPAPSAGSLPAQLRTNIQPRRPGGVQPSYQGTDPPPPPVTQQQLLTIREKYVHQTIPCTRLPS